MDIYQQHVIVIGDPEQRHPQQRKLTESEWPHRILGDPQAHALFALPSGELRKIGEVDFDRTGFVDILDGFPVEFAKGRPPCLVTADDFMEARL